MKLKVTFNAPVVLTVAIISFIVSMVSAFVMPLNQALAFGGILSLNPLKLLCLLTYPVAHGDFYHLFGNLMFLLLLGPVLEEKYGSRRLLLMFIMTSIISGLIIGILPLGGIMGASGLVFMCIMLISITDCREGEIPLTLILIALIYLGQELIRVFNDDNISQLGHLIGGVCGIVFGLVFREER